MTGTVGKRGRRRRRRRKRETERQRDRETERQTERQRDTQTKGSRYKCTFAHLVNVEMPVLVVWCLCGLQTLANTSGKVEKV